MIPFVPLLFFLTTGWHCSFKNWRQWGEWELQYWCNMAQAIITASMRIKVVEWKEVTTPEESDCAKAEETRKYDTLSGAIFVCCSESLHIGGDKSVSERERTRWDRRTWLVFPIESAQSWETAFTEPTRRTLCWQTDCCTLLQDTPDSTWSTAVLFHCRRVIPAVYRGPVNRNLKGEMKLLLLTRWTSHIAHFTQCSAGTGRRMEQLCLMTYTRALSPPLLYPALFCLTSSHVEGPQVASVTCPLYVSTLLYIIKQTEVPIIW